MVGLRLGPAGFARRLPMSPQPVGPWPMSRRQRGTQTQIAMMWYWGSGYGWGMAIVGVLMMLLLWGAIATAIVFVVRSLSATSVRPADSAMQMLRRRLAAGEITSDEFERIRKVLEG